MKFTVQAHVMPWAPPTKVHFDEGLKLPLGCVDREVIEYLCETWMAAVCEQAGIEFELSFTAPMGDE